MQMKLLSLWPLFLIQITSMLLTFIILKRNAVSFSWRYILICSVSMMMAEIFIFIKYATWYLPRDMLFVAGVPPWLLLLLHAGYFSDISRKGRQWVWGGIAFIISGSGMALYWWLLTGIMSLSSG